MELLGKRVFNQATPVEPEPRGRDSLFLAARLRIAGFPDVLSVRVRNLSSGGLMAELPDPLSTTDVAVDVEVRGIGWISGRVAWQTEGRIGIAFDREIDPQRARKPVGAGKTEAGQGSFKPRL